MFKVALFVSVSVIALCASSGCGTQPPGGDSVLVAQTGDASLPLVAFDGKGNALFIKANQGTGQPFPPSGAVYILPSGESLTVYLGPDGLPTRAVVQPAGDVFVFENYTDSTVDIAMIHSNGTTELRRGVAVDAGSIANLKALWNGKPKHAAELSKNFWLGVKIAAVAIGTATCILGTGGTAAVACGLAFLGLVGTISETAAETSTITSAFVCGASPPIGCLATAANIGLMADQSQQQLQNEINSATNQLSGATTDSDGDGTPDSSDSCPNNPNKTDPGNCGCGQAETSGCGSSGGCGAGWIQNPANGHCYKLVNNGTPLSWTQAKTAAEAMGGHLATITSADENNFIATQLLIGCGGAGGSVIFIGGQQDPAGSEPAGGWGWITGEPWSYTNWNSPTEPNNSGNEDWLTIFCSGANHGKWNDTGLTGSSYMHYIVEQE